MVLGLFYTSNAPGYWRSTRQARCDSSFLWCLSTNQTVLASFDSPWNLQKTGPVLEQVDPFGQLGSNAIVSNVIHDLLLSKFLHLPVP